MSFNAILILCFSDILLLFIFNYLWRTKSFDDKSMKNIWHAQGEIKFLTVTNMEKEFCFRVYNVYQSIWEANSR